VAAPTKQMVRYLKIGAAGEGQILLATGYDLPRCARSKVA